MNNHLLQILILAFSINLYAQEVDISFLDQIQGFDHPSFNNSYDQLISKYEDIPSYQVMEQTGDLVLGFNLPLPKTFIEIDQFFNFNYSVNSNKNIGIGFGWSQSIPQLAFKENSIYPMHSLLLKKERYFFQKSPRSSDSKFGVEYLTVKEKGIRIFQKNNDWDIYSDGLKYRFNKYGDLISIYDAYDNSIIISYLDNGQLSEVFDPQNKIKIKYYYDETSKQTKYYLGKFQSSYNRIKYILISNQRIKTSEKYLFTYEDDHLIKVAKQGAKKFLFHVKYGRFDSIKYENSDIKLNNKSQAVVFNDDLKKPKIIDSKKYLYVDLNNDKRADRILVYRDLFVRMLKQEIQKINEDGYDSKNDFDLNYFRERFNSIFKFGRVSNSGKTKIFYQVEQYNKKNKQYELDKQLTDQLRPMMDLFDFQLSIKKNGEDDKYYINDMKIISNGLFFKDFNFDGKVDLMVCDVPLHQNLPRYFEQIDPIKEFAIKLNNYKMKEYFITPVSDMPVRSGKIYLQEVNFEKVKNKIKAGQFPFLGNIQFKLSANGVPCHQNPVFGDFNHDFQLDYILGNELVLTGTNSKGRLTTATKEIDLEFIKNNFEVDKKFSFDGSISYQNVSGVVRGKQLILPGKLAFTKQEDDSIYLASEKLGYKINPVSAMSLPEISYSNFGGEIRYTYLFKAGKIVIKQIQRVDTSKSNDIYEVKKYDYQNMKYNLMGKPMGFTKITTSDYLDTFQDKTGPIIQHELSKFPGRVTQVEYQQNISLKSTNSFLSFALNNQVSSERIFDLAKNKLHSEVRKSYQSHELGSDRFFIGIKEAEQMTYPRATKIFEGKPNEFFKRYQYENYPMQDNVKRGPLKIIISSEETDKGSDGGVMSSWVEKNYQYINIFTGEQVINQTLKSPNNKDKITFIKYNKFGKVLSRTTGDLFSSFSYDSQGRVVETNNHWNDQTRIGYLGKTNLVSKKVSSDYNESYSFENQLNLVSSFNQDQTKYFYEYNDDHQIKKLEAVSDNDRVLLYENKGIDYKQRTAEFIEKGVKSEIKFNRFGQLINLQKKYHDKKYNLVDREYLWGNLPSFQLWPHLVDHNKYNKEVFYYDSLFKKSKKEIYQNNLHQENLDELYFQDLNCQHKYAYPGVLPISIEDYNKKSIRCSNSFGESYVNEDSDDHFIKYNNFNQVAQIDEFNYQYNDSKQLINFQTNKSNKKEIVNFEQSFSGLKQKVDYNGSSLLKDHKQRVIQFTGRNVKIENKFDKGLIKSKIYSFKNKEIFRVQYKYDGLKRISGIHTPWLKQSFTYNKFSYLEDLNIETTVGKNVFKYTYLNGALSSIKDVILKTEYNDQGNISKLHYANDLTVGLTYDDLLRELTGISYGFSKFNISFSGRKSFRSPRVDVFNNKGQVGPLNLLKFLDSEGEMNDSFHFTTPLFNSSVLIDNQNRIISDHDYKYEYHNNLLIEVTSKKDDDSRYLFYDDQNELFAVCKNGFISDQSCIIHIDKNLVIYYGEPIYYLRHENLTIGAVIENKFYFLSQDIMGSINTVFTTDKKFNSILHYTFWGTEEEYKDGSVENNFHLKIRSMITQSYAGMYRFDFEGNQSLHYSKTRTYNSKTARWLTIDHMFINQPQLLMANSMNLNPWSYAANRPLNYVDSTGNSTITAGVGWGVRAGSLAGPVGTVVGGLVGGTIGWAAGDHIANLFANVFNNDTKVNTTEKKAPKVSDPDSITEQIDKKTGKVKSRTFHDENGRSFSRQDFDHSHGGKQPHEHIRDFDSKGRPRSREQVRDVPNGYDNNPSQ